MARDRNPDSDAGIWHNSQFFLDSIVDNLPSMIFVKDADELRFVLVNKAGERLLGFSRAELIGRNDYDFFPKEEADFFTAKDREVLDGRKFVDIPEEPIHTRNIGRRILHTRKIPLLDEHSRPRFLLGISEDVTAQKEIEDDLRLQSEIVRNMTEGVILTRSADGVVVFANPSSERILGLAEGGLTGRPMPIAQIDSSEVQDQLREDGLWSGEIQSRRQDGSSLWTSVRVSSFDHPSFGPLWITTLEDISDRKTVEDRFRQADHLASIGTLAAGIAHEINNPVGAILLHAEAALRNPKAPPDVGTNLRHIVEQSKRCGRIVRSVLRTARRESTEKWWTDINVSVHRAKYMVHDVIQERQAHVELQLANAPPEIRINPTEIEQLLVNLLRNAIQSRSSGVQVTVRTTVTPQTLRIEVEDDGPGIPEPRRSQVFDPFHTTRQHLGGTGLGLSIVHGIVQSHEGAIDLTCPPDGGTRITIDLPLGAPRQDGQRS